MSGICGISENARNFGARAIAPMLQELTLPGEWSLSSCGSLYCYGYCATLEFPRRSELRRCFCRCRCGLAGYLRGESGAFVAVGVSSEISAEALIARLYEDRGVDFLKSLHGAFSIGLWDESKQRLILAIDRIGIKSLFWRREGKRLLFASRIGAIAGCSGIARRSQLPANFNSSFLRGARAARDRQRYGEAPAWNVSDV